jgi:hypothetical protein
MSKGRERMAKVHELHFDACRLAEQGKRSGGAFMRKHQESNAHDETIASDLDTLESARVAAKELRKSLDQCDALSRSFAGHPGETDTSMHRLVALLLDGKGER